MSKKLGLGSSELERSRTLGVEEKARRLAHRNRLIGVIVFWMQSELVGRGDKPARRRIVVDDGPVEVDRDVVEQLRLELEFEAIRARRERDELLAT